MSIGIVLQKSSALRSFSVSVFVIAADFVEYKVGFFVNIHIFTREVDNTGMEEKTHVAAES